MGLAAPVISGGLRQHDAPTLFSSDPSYSSTRYPCTCARETQSGMVPTKEKHVDVRPLIPLLLGTQKFLVASKQSNSWLGKSTYIAYFLFGRAVRAGCRQTIKEHSSPTCFRSVHLLGGSRRIEITPSWGIAHDRSPPDWSVRINPKLLLMGSYMFCNSLTRTPEHQEQQSVGRFRYIGWWISFHFTNCSRFLVTGIASLELELSPRHGSAPPSRA